MSKKNKKQQVPKQRNWVAVAAHFKTGAGSHGSKKSYTRKVKHKGRQVE
tara:strand:+ start:329 stop:475 length:147 start_codon:yes stop_codon:yes gene_type:complete